MRHSLYIEAYIMAKYRKMVDIWTLSNEQRAQLQPGQWVSAGPADAVGSNCGRWYGFKRTSSSEIVAWNGNARASKNWNAYQRSLAIYAKGR